jgi:F0F1-type ATP synthase membrane subunit c/vacuolar-type H+-ATPase subunit K
MVTQQVFQLSIRVIPFLILAMTVSFSPSAQADLGGVTFKNDGSGARGIQELCAPAAGSIARQPEAEDAILAAVRDGFANIREKHKKLKGGSRGVPESIGVIRGAAIEAVARNPEAGGKVLNLVEECEAELDKLGNTSSRYGIKGQRNY